MLGLRELLLRYKLQTLGDELIWFWHGFLTLSLSLGYPEYRKLSDSTISIRILDISMKVLAVRAGSHKPSVNAFRDVKVLVDSPGVEFDF